MQALDATSALPRPTLPTRTQGSRPKADPLAPVRREDREDAESRTRATEDDTLELRSLRIQDQETGPTPTSTPVVPAEEDRDRLAEIVEAMREQKPSIGEGSLKISYNDDVSRYVVQIVDRETGDEIQQIPSEQLLEVSKRLGEMRGLLFDEKS